MTERERLHVLVDDLAEEEVSTAIQLLETLRVPGGEDPVERLLRDAPLDDEPLSDEELAALAESDEDIAAGRVISHEEARRELLER